MSMSSMSGDWELAAEKAQSAYENALKGGADRDGAVGQALAAAHNFMQANGHRDAEYAEKLERLTKQWA